MTDTRMAAVEEAVQRHAQHIVAGDVTAIEQDCDPQVLQTPEDLYTQLCTSRFERYDVLGHAKIGFQHILKVRYIGPTAVTLHHRLGERDGKWLVLESERL